MPTPDTPTAEPERSIPDLVRDTRTVLRYKRCVAAKKSKRGGVRPGSGRKPILKDRASLKVSLDGETYERLAKVAEERETSMGALVREAVERYLSKSRSKRSR